MGSKKKKTRRNADDNQVVDAVEVSFDDETSVYTIVSSSKAKGAKYPWIHAVVIVDSIQIFSTNYQKQTSRTAVAGALLKQAAARARRKTDVRPCSPNSMIRSRSSAPLNRDRSLDNNHDLIQERRESTSPSGRSIQSSSGDSIRSKKRGNFLTLSLSKGSSQSSLVPWTGSTPEAKPSRKKRSRFFLRRNFLPRPQRTKLRKLVEEFE